MISCGKYMYMYIPQELLTSLNIDQPYIMTSVDNDVAIYIINDVIIDFVTSFK